MFQFVIFFVGFVSFDLGVAADRRNRQRIERMTEQRTETDRRKMHASTQRPHHTQHTPTHTVHALSLAMDKGTEVTVRSGAGAAEDVRRWRRWTEGEERRKLGRTAAKAETTDNDATEEIYTRARDASKHNRHYERNGNERVRCASAERVSVYGTDFSRAVYVSVERFSFKICRRDGWALHVSARA